MWIAASVMVLFGPVGAVRAQTAGRVAIPMPVTALRLDSARFSIVAEREDDRLARSLLAAAVATDTFPGLPRPQEKVLIAIAPDATRFREWVGPNAPK